MIGKVITHMRTTRWIFALALAMIAAVGSASASSVKDGAGLFGADAVRQATVELNRIETENAIATTVETVASLDGATVGQKTREHAERSGNEGLYILIAKNEGKIDVISSIAYRDSMSGARLRAIEGAFIAGLKHRDFDGALLGGVKEVDSEVSAARSELGTLRQGAAAGRVGHNGRVVANRNGSRGISSLLGIGLLVIGVLFVVRILGSLFRGGGVQGAYGPGRMGAPGSGGYGGGGGGFMSSMFGGIGGALAGNWLYDQFSGRHSGGNHTDSSSYGDAEAGNAGNDWSGGADAGGADWGGGGGDSGGGDWGGGGGGGDWGGGGDGGSW